MATLISTDDSVYFTNFATGNDFTPSTYVTYANDLDANFLALRTTINQLVQEVSAIGGPNAVISLDLALPASPVVPTGILGVDSFAITLSGSDLLIATGVMIQNTVRVEGTVPLTIPGSGGAATRWVNISPNGVGSVQTSASAVPGVDIATAEWDGAAYTAGSEIFLIEILANGDSYRDERTRPANGGWVARTSLDYYDSGGRFSRVEDRIVAIERALTGFSTDGGAEPVSKVGFHGTVSLPGLFPTDGAATRETTTGFYRAAANVVGLAASGVVSFIMGSFGIRIKGGDPSTPSIALNTDTNTGFRFGLALIGLVSAGADVAQVVAGQFSTVLGIVNAPVWTFIGDLTTGIYSPGAGRVRLANSGVASVEFTAEGHVDFILQPRIRMDIPTFSMTSSALSLADIDSDEADIVYEVGDWGTSENNPDHSIPTGGDGTYLVSLAVTFDESGSGANTGQRVIAISADGTDRALMQVDAVRAPGGVQTFLYVLPGTSGVDVVVPPSGSANADVNHGFVMPRAGSVTAVSILGDVTGFTVGGDVAADVYLDGGDTGFAATIPVAGNGDEQTAQATQAVGLDTFGAGEKLGVTLDFDGTLDATLGDVLVAVEVTFTGSGSPTKLVTTTELDLGATDIVKARAAQNSGGTMNVTDVELSIRKVA